MENASKAIYMVGGVLVGLMIISLFIYIFRAGGKFGEKYEQSQNQGQLELYNSKFENFQRENNTISDMVTVTNLANDVNTEANYNFDMSVSIDIEIGNKTFSITPNYKIERNYIFIAKSNNVTATSPKIYVYDLLNAKKEELKNSSGSAISISSPVFENGDTLSKVNKDMQYKYFFECTDLKYHENGGRVSYMSFKLIKNPDPGYVDSLT